MTTIKEDRVLTYMTENTIKIQMYYFNVGRTEYPYNSCRFI